MAWKLREPIRLTRRLSWLVFNLVNQNHPTTSFSRIIYFYFAYFVVFIWCYLLFCCYIYFMLFAILFTYWVRVRDVPRMTFTMTLIQLRFNHNGITSNICELRVFKEKRVYERNFRPYYSPRELMHLIDWYYTQKIKCFTCHNLIRNDE